jgi:hypothetical protein
MRILLGLAFTVVVACGGQLLDSTPPPPSSDASATSDADDASTTTPHPPVDCSNLGSCLDGGCNTAPPQDPIALVVGQKGDMTGLATDGTNVYWAVDQAVGFIRSCSTNGCTAPTDYANTLNPFAVSVVGSTVYWFDGPEGAVKKCAGGATCPNPTVVLTGLWNPWNTFAVGDGRVFFAVMGGSLQSCSVDGCGGAYTTVAPMGQLDTIAVGGSTVYWRDGKSDDVRACDGTSCPTPTIVAAKQGTFGGIAANACAAYWPNFDNGSVMMCAAGGCSNGPTTLASNQFFSSNGPIAVDDSGVYWASTQGILTCELGGCAQPRLLAKTTGAFAIALDGSNVYWATPGAVWKVSK